MIYLKNEKAILVTGATGTVGSEVVKQLASLGQNVKASVHTQSKANKFKDQNGIDTVGIDFYKPETIADAFRHVDRVFLLTPPSPDMTNLYSTLITEAKKNDIKYIVKLSVIGADIEPGITIGRLHRQEEKIIEESGMPYTFLRSGAFMQNFVNFFGQTIREQNAIYLIHVMKYLGSTHESNPSTDKLGLEAFLDTIQPGWRNVVVRQRFLPSMVVYNAIVTAGQGGTIGRPDTKVPKTENLYIVGDWVGTEGLLADASFASAKRAAEQILKARPMLVSYV